MSEQGESSGAAVEPGSHLSPELGTCTMKPRTDQGVIDTQLNVYSVTNLKVADMSIVPINVGTNTYWTALLIGEKAAVIIADELGIGCVFAVILSMYFTGSAWKFSEVHDLMVSYQACASLRHEKSIGCHCWMMDSIFQVDMNFTKTGRQVTSVELMGGVEE
ncbi:hypothetical protein BDR06DRAFT_971515 [Suillus hirtellus]|nr:hypothetical protein BDR06DRAFT_971515 [Suillus hirtellus]